MRSDREHCASRVAVEEEEERRGGGGEEQATDIKSNNPHLTGGEQINVPTIAFLMVVPSRSDAVYNGLPVTPSQCGVMLKFGWATAILSSKQHQILENGVASLSKISTTPSESFMAL